MKIKAIYKGISTIGRYQNGSEYTISFITWASKLHVAIPLGDQKIKDEIVYSSLGEFLSDWEVID